MIRQRVPAAERAAGVERPPRRSRAVLPQQRHQDGRLDDTKGVLSLVEVAVAAVVVVVDSAGLVVVLAGRAEAPPAGRAGREERGGGGGGSCELGRQGPR